MNRDIEKFLSFFHRLEKLGWVENCPSQEYWEYQKKNWICKIYSSLYIEFYRIGGKND